MILYNIPSADMPTKQLFYGDIHECFSTGFAEAEAEAILKEWGQIDDGDERQNWIQLELEDLMWALAKMSRKEGLGAVYEAVLNDGNTMAMKRLKDAVVVVMANDGNEDDAWAMISLVMESNGDRNAELQIHIEGVGPFNIKKLHIFSY
ncbi:hypothetical protein FF1_041194 [Malus domestica]